MMSPRATPDLPEDRPPRLTVFLPVYNEASSIAGVLREFSETVTAPARARLLVCEDGSTDGGREVLELLGRSLPLELVTSPNRKGYANAARDGLQRITTEFVFFSDSDGQYDPSDFWKIWNARGSFDMVIGRKDERQERFYRIVLSRGFHLLVKAFTAVPLRDMDCGFRLIRREVVASVLPEVRSLKYSFWAEFSIIAYRKGFRILEVPVRHRPSLRGSTSIYSWNRLPRILVLQVLGLLNLARRLNRTVTKETRATPPGTPRAG